MDSSNSYTPSSEIEIRINKLQQHLKAHAIDGAFILQNTDLLQLPIIIII